MVALAWDPSAGPTNKALLVTMWALQEDRSREAVGSIVLISVPSFWGIPSKGPDFHRWDFLNSGLPKDFQQLPNKNPILRLSASKHRHLQAGHLLLGFSLFPQRRNTTVKTV